ncbi:Bet1-like protein [Sesamum angolense]|uniref:Bet1-like protein n=1 Tax=Sesamum angolense TaxID=2727404 RepID=A0AAE1WJR4_9LAMI|nr:Bet1-like protein [Sesamum angolense]
MADPYRSREGLSTRSSSAAYGGYSDEVQVRIDPDFDDEVTGLRKQVRRLRDVAQDIETEAKSQNDFLNQLQMTLIKAQAGVKNNMRRLNKSIIREGSNHVMHLARHSVDKSHSAKLSCGFLSPTYMQKQDSRQVVPGSVPKSSSPILLLVSSGVILDL